MRDFETRASRFLAATVSTKQPSTTTIALVSHIAGKTYGSQPGCPALRFSRSQYIYIQCLEVLMKRLPSTSAGASRRKDRKADPKVIL
jgi:hypothetical protein